MPPPNPPCGHPPPPMKPPKPRMLPQGAMWRLNKTEDGDPWTALKVSLDTELTNAVEICDEIRGVDIILDADDLDWLIEALQAARDTWINNKG